MPYGESIVGGEMQTSGGLCYECTEFNSTVPFRLLLLFCYLLSSVFRLPASILFFAVGMVLNDMIRLTGGFSV